MRRVAIVAPTRTAVGTFGGTLRPLAAHDLATEVIKAVVERSGVDPALIDDVVLAQSYANSEAPCIGRWAALGVTVALQGIWDVMYGPWLYNMIPTFVCIVLLFSATHFRGQQARSGGP